MSQERIDKIYYWFSWMLYVAKSSLQREKYQDELLDLAKKTIVDIGENPQDIAQHTKECCERDKQNLFLISKFVLENCLYHLVPNDKIDSFKSYIKLFYTNDL